MSLNFSQRTHGHPSCACLVEAMVGEILSNVSHARIGGMDYAFGSTGAIYAYHYGVGCSAHDMNLEPYCVSQYCGEPIHGECVPRWCGEPWCWVNASECIGFPPAPPSSYFVQVDDLQFSYATCGGTNMFSSYYADIIAPTPPPPAPAASPRYDEEIGYGVGLGTLLLVGLLVVIWHMYRRRKRQLDQIDRTKVNQAINLSTTLRHTAALVPAVEFRKLGRLCSFEELRDRQLLRYCDSLEAIVDLVSEGYAILFISHQWTSFTAPDPSNEQFRAMVKGLELVAQARGWVLERVYVWVDYSSVPQVNKAEQMEAINSIGAYASCAHAFLIVAPEVAHANTGALCDINTYRGRMWCRAEQLSFSLINGTSSMFLVTGEEPDAFEPLGSRPSAWLEENLRVFEGTATDDRDKMSLVAPMLGLYAQLVLIEGGAQRTQTHQATHPELAAADEATLLRQQTMQMTGEMLSLIRRQKTALFPRTVQIVHTLEEGERHTAAKPATEVLFGGLIQKLDEMVAEMLSGGGEDGGEGGDTSFCHGEQRAAVSVNADGAAAPEAAGRVRTSTTDDCDSGVEAGPVSTSTTATAKSRLHKTSAQMRQLEALRKHTSNRRAANDAGHQRMRRESIAQPTRSLARGIPSPMGKMRSWIHASLVGSELSEDRRRSRPTRAPSSAKIMPHPASSGALAISDGGEPGNYADARPPPVVNDIDVKR